MLHVVSSIIVPDLDELTRLGNHLALSCYDTRVDIVRAYPHRSSALSVFAASSFVHAPSLSIRCVRMPTGVEESVCELRFFAHPCMQSQLQVLYDACALVVELSDQVLFLGGLNSPFPEVVCSERVSDDNDASLTYECLISFSGSGVVRRVS